MVASHAGRAVTERRIQARLTNSVWLYFDDRPALGGGPCIVVDDYNVGDLMVLSLDNLPSDPEDLQFSVERWVLSVKELLTASRQRKTKWDRKRKRKKR